MAAVASHLADTSALARLRHSDASCQPSRYSLPADSVRGYAHGSRVMGTPSKPRVTYSHAAARAGENVLSLGLAGGQTGAEAVLLSGVYGAGKSSVAEEIAFLLEQPGVLCALLDLDHLGWASTGSGSRAAGFRLMLRNLEAVAAKLPAGRDPAVRAGPLRPRRRGVAGCAGGSRVSVAGGAAGSPAGRVSPSRPGSTGPASSTACWSTHPLTTSGARRCPPNHLPSGSPTCNSKPCSPPPGNPPIPATSLWWPCSGSWGCGEASRMSW
jgi:hypothetical protein